ncbi:MAG: prepilin-type N-terminal cleavage/methylation domain-containing protein [Candidatus Wallbacteria bacterium]|nr:prepilin-type N-terminal cleavage/methylation domain-containing protein [Candidatus Wallbacteria bacterium]
MRNRGAFTIIELLVVVTVCGVLAVAALSKYQSFAESSRRKTCLAQLKEIETGIAVWETNNTAFSETSKCAWGFTPRTGRLTSTAPAVGSGDVLPSNQAGVVAGIADSRPTVGAPSTFLNNAATGPLSAITRDDNLWICPAALSRYYSGEIQNVSDDYLDTDGGGTNNTHGSSPIGLGGRYLGVASGPFVGNGGFPFGWIAGAASAPDALNPAPCPQTPFRIVLCGCYGTFGPSSSLSSPGVNSTNLGGPVGPDGSALNRHSPRW